MSWICLSTAIKIGRIDTETNDAKHVRSSTSRSSLRLNFIPTQDSSVQDGPGAMMLTYTILNSRFSVYIS